MNNIRTIRKKIGMTQMQLSERLHISRAAVAMWETGKSMPRADMLPQIADVLGCTVNELYADEPPQAAF